MPDPHDIYYIPDPVSERHAYVAVYILSDSLFSLEFVGPSRHHVTPVNIDSWISTRFSASPAGPSFEIPGRVYELQQGTLSTERVLDLSEQAAQYAFAYWWALNYDGFDPAVHPDESYGERQNRLSVLDQVAEDGSVTLSDGSIHTTEYDRSTVTAVHHTNWETPAEVCTRKLNDLLQELSATYPERDVQTGYENTLNCLSTSSKETATKPRETLQRVLEDTPGVGPTHQETLTEHFSSLEELCEDLGQDAPVTRSLNGIGDSKVESLTATAQTTDVWTEL